MSVKRSAPRKQVVESVDAHQGFSHQFRLARPRGSTVSGKGAQSVSVQRRCGHVGAKISVRVGVRSYCTNDGAEFIVRLSIGTVPRAVREQSLADLKPLDALGSHGAVSQPSDHDQARGVHDGVVERACTVFCC